jgi:hypothetical protein
MLCGTSMHYTTVILSDVYFLQILHIVDTVVISVSSDVHVSLLSAG